MVLFRDVWLMVSAIVIWEMGQWAFGYLAFDYRPKKPKDNEANDDE